jgi:hypothetical protein
MQVHITSDLQLRGQRVTAANPFQKNSTLELGERSAELVEHSSAAQMQQTYFNGHHTMHVSAMTMSLT